MMEGVAWFYPCESCEVASDGVCNLCDYKLLCSRIEALAGKEICGISACALLDEYIGQSIERDKVCKPDDAQMKQYVRRAI